MWVISCVIVPCVSGPSPFTKIVGSGCAGMRAMRRTAVASLASVALTPDEHGYRDVRPEHGIEDDDRCCEVARDRVPLFGRGSVRRRRRGGTARPGARPRRVVVARPPAEVGTSASGRSAWASSPRRAPLARLGAGVPQLASQAMTSARGTPITASSTRAAVAGLPRERVTARRKLRRRLAAFRSRCSSSPRRDTACCSGPAAPASSTRRGACRS